MNFNKIFDDKDSQNLHKQIREAQTYIHKELDKSIMKQLILRIMEKGYLPVLEYPVRLTQYAMPMHYSRQQDHQINIHTPIPNVRLYTKQEYEDIPILKDPNEEMEEKPRIGFDELLEDMKQRVEKLALS